MNSCSETEIRPPIFPLRSRIPSRTIALISASASLRELLTHGTSLRLSVWFALRGPSAARSDARIKELAGHKSIETTLRYMHTDRDAKRGAIAALRAASAQSPAKMS
jgi:hypothetical protein